MCEEGGWIRAGWGEEEEREVEDEEDEEEEVEKGGVVRLMPRGSEFGFLCLLGEKEPRAASSSYMRASEPAVNLSVFPVVCCSQILFVLLLWFLSLIRAYIRASERLFLFSCVVLTVAKKSV